MRFKISLCLVLLLLLCPFACAVEEYEVEHEFLPDTFIFEYNDHNTTTYEGDSGLILGHVNNTLDNTTLILPKERVRSMAYATKGTFKLKEPMIITHSIERPDGRYVLLTMRFKNGTVVPILDIENTDLTSEQKKYFDDYYGERSDYLAQQQQYAAEDLYDYAQLQGKYNSRSKYSYYFGSGGSGVIYTPGYNSY